MSSQRPPLSRAFFLELLLVFAIFAFSAVICLQVFASANQESERSVAITELGIRSQMLAENFKDNDGRISGLAMLEEAESDPDTLSWYYDDELNIVEASEARFVLSCTVDDSGDLKVATLVLSEDGQELFRYDVSKYTGIGEVSS